MLKFLSVLTVLCLVSPVAAQAAPTLGRADAVAWDAVTLDVNGQPDTITFYDVAIVASGANLNTAGTAVIVSVTVTAPKLDTTGTVLLATLANGNYVAQVRARDAAGNVSAWSAPFAFGFDGVPPTAPANVRKK